MKKIAQTILFLTILSACTYGQEQKTVAKFIINDARLNRNDQTEFYLNAEAYLVFYFDIDSVPCMANVMPNKGTQSFGKLFAHTHKGENETNEGYPADYFSYKWSYENDYDNKKGTADVILIKTYKPQGVIFTCTIITENLDVLVYKGYLQGSIDFSKF